MIIVMCETKNGNNDGATWYGKKWISGFFAPNEMGEAHERINALVANGYNAYIVIN